MQTYKEVIIKDTAPYELADKQRQLTRRLERNHEETTTAQDYIVELETKLEHLAHDNQLPIKDSSILQEIQNELTRVVNKLQDNTIQINGFEVRAKELEDQLSRLQYQINAHTPNDLVLSQDQLKPILASDPRIKEVQLFGYYEHSGTLPLFRKLSFRMNGVVATLSSRDQHLINKRFAPTDTVYAALPDLRVHIRRNNVSMLPIRGQGIGMYARGLTCHPHITSAVEGAACWGDFGGPIQESLDNKDFHTTIALTTLFLETIDPQDPAGGTYPALITKQINHWVNANLAVYDAIPVEDTLGLLWITYPDGSCLPIGFNTPRTPLYDSWNDVPRNSDFYKHVVNRCNYYQQNPDELKANNFIAPNPVITLQEFESDPTFDELFDDSNPTSDELFEALRQMQTQQETETA
mgnify:CR=1 FL=1